jgi:hypothetical protein
VLMVNWRNIYTVDRAEQKLRAAGCQHGFVKTAWDFAEGRSMIVVEVPTAAGRLKFSESEKQFPSDELLAKIALVAP